MKRGPIIGLVALIVLIALGVYFYISNLHNNAPLSSDCGIQGQTVRFTDPHLNKCCEGLENVHTSDSISVEDECYWIGTESGAPILTCSDCGNGICEDVESVCGCPKDCVKKRKSDFLTVKDFCTKGYKYYCGRLPAGMELDLCKLCA